LGWRWWDIGGSRLERKWLHDMLRRWVGVFIGGVRIALPPLVVGNGLGGMVWWGLETLKRVSILNGRWAIVTLIRCVPLHTIDLTDGVDPD